jgi:hypothetical protein
MDQAFDSSFSTPPTEQIDPQLAINQQVLTRLEALSSSSEILITATTNLTNLVARLLVAPVSSVPADQIAVPQTSTLDENQINFGNGTGVQDPRGPLRPRGQTDFGTVLTAGLPQISAFQAAVERVRTEREIPNRFSENRPASTRIVPNALNVRDSRSLRESFGGGGFASPFAGRARDSSTGGGSDALHQAAEDFRAEYTVRPDDYLLGLNYDRHHTLEVGNYGDGHVILTRPSDDLSVKVLFASLDISSIVRNVLALEALLRRFQSIRSLQILSLISINYEDTIINTYNREFSMSLSRAEIAARFQAVQPWNDPGVSVSALVRCVLASIPRGEKETALIFDSIKSLAFFPSSFQFTWLEVSKAFAGFVRVIDCYIAISVIIFPSFWSGSHKKFIAALIECMSNPSTIFGQFLSTLDPVNYTVQSFMQALQDRIASEMNSMSAIVLRRQVASKQATPPAVQDNSSRHKRFSGFVGHMDESSAVSDSEVCDSGAWEDCDQSSECDSSDSSPADFTEFLGAIQAMHSRADSARPCYSYFESLRPENKSKPKAEQVSCTHSNCRFSHRSDWPNKVAEYEAMRPGLLALWASKK